MDLQGRTIAVTRAEQQLGAARQLFEQAGAEVLDLPALVIRPPDEWGPLDDAQAELEEFHWLIVSSSNGVDAVEQRLQRLPPVDTELLLEQLGGVLDGFAAAEGDRIHPPLGEGGCGGGR